MLNIYTFGINTDIIWFLPSTSHQFSASNNNHDSNNRSSDGAMDLHRWDPPDMTHWYWPQTKQVHLGLPLFKWSLMIAGIMNWSGLLGYSDRVLCAVCFHLVNWKFLLSSQLDLLRKNSTMLRSDTITVSNHDTHHLHHVRDWITYLFDNQSLCSTVTCSN